MVSPALDRPVDRTQGASEAPEAPLLSDYLETIEILQEEVARLERELQERDAGLHESAAVADNAVPEEPRSAAEEEAAAAHAEQVQRLKSELAERDQTIVLLLDELDRVEETQRANRAEWDQLTGWVAELEHRVEGQDCEAMLRLESRLAAQQQKAEALERKAEQDARAWETQRRMYQGEITQLQTALDQVTAAAGAGAGASSEQAGAGDAVDSGVVEALQAENSRLRAAWQELVERTAAVEDSQSAEAKLAESQRECVELRRRIEQIEDDRKREQLEHEAKAAELHARISQAPQTQAQAQTQTQTQEAPGEKKADGQPRERDLDLRIRALREHLQEIEERERSEREERRQKNLIVRLSRLWSRTGPR